MTLATLAILSCPRARLSSQIDAEVKKEVTNIMDNTEWTMGRGEVFHQIPNSKLWWVNGAKARLNIHG